MATWPSRSRRRVATRVSHPMCSSTQRSVPASKSRNATHQFRKLHHAHMIVVKCETQGLEDANPAVRVTVHDDRVSTGSRESVVVLSRNVTCLHHGCRPGPAHEKRGMYSYVPLCPHILAVTVGWMGLPHGSPLIRHARTLTIKEFGRLLMHIPSKVRIRRWEQPGTQVSRALLLQPGRAGSPARSPSW